MGTVFACDILITTRRFSLPCSKAAMDKALGFTDDLGGAMASSFFGVAWLFVLAFLAGGFAGVLLTSLMHTASANWSHESEGDRRAPD